MKPSKIWLVVPFSRPKFLENVKKNISQQNFKDIKLCIVENGDAIGYCKSVGFEPDLLLTSGNHQSKAKNAGIAEIRSKYPGSYVSIFDDDDYYGPNYLQEIYESSDKADVVGKLCIITKLANDQMVLTHDIGYYNTYVPYVQSATASYWADDAFDYNENLKSGEENFWAGQMTRSGRKIYSTSMFNFCYMRRLSGHTYQATDEQFMDRGSRPLGDFDLDIVNRVKKVEMLEVRMGTSNNFKSLKMKHDESKVFSNNLSNIEVNHEEKAKNIAIAKSKRDKIKEKAAARRRAYKNRISKSKQR